MKTKHKNHSNFDLYDDVEKIKAALMNTASDVKGKAGEVIYDSMEEVKNKTDYVKDSVSEYTAEKPFQSLGIALLIGVALGYFIRK